MKKTDPMKGRPNQMPQFDVFLSHNSVDKSWVIKLKDDLQRYGVSVWLDKDEIRPGDLFAEALEEGLANSRAVALVVSPEAIASGWVKEEYYRALSLAQSKQSPLQLIPVMLRNVELPGFLEGRTWVDFRDKSAYSRNVWELVWGITGNKPGKTLDLSLPKAPSTSSSLPRKSQIASGLGVFGLLLIILIGIILLCGFGLIAYFFLPIFQPQVQANRLTPTTTPQPTFTPVAVRSQALIPNPEPTNTLSPTLTRTPLPTPTFTPTPNFVVVLVDASKRMEGRQDDGTRKIDTAWQTAWTIGRKRVDGGHLVKIRYFGSQASSAAHPCRTSSALFKDFLNDSEQLNYYMNTAPDPKDRADVVTGLIDAAKDFPEDQQNIGREIILLTGGPDECNVPLTQFYNDSAYESLVSETHVVIFDDEYYEDFTKLQLRGVEIAFIEVVRSEEEGKNVGEKLGNTPTPIPAPTSAPQTLPPSPDKTATATSSSSEINKTQVPVYTNTPFNTPTPIMPTASPTDTPTPITPTATPTDTPMPTNTPIPTPTPTNTSIPTPTPTNTLIPTPTPTQPFRSTPLPTQTAVFAQNCPLINESKEFNQFSQGQASISSNLVADGHTGQGLSLNFSGAKNEGGHYSGWEVWLGEENSGINLSSYSSLVFYIRGKNGGEEPNIYLMMPIIDEEFERFWKDVEQVVEVTKSWQQVVIPLSHFTSSGEVGQQVDLENIHRIQILFEWYEQTTSGQIFIDDLCVQ